MNKAPKTPIEIHFNGEAYMFHLYYNNYKRYVALCNTVGCSDHYGEGADWWSAVNECMSKINEYRRSN
jgi:hypothetical protein